jgi:hypothetical protein
LDITGNYLAGYPFLKKFSCSKAIEKDIAEEDDEFAAESLKGHSKKSQLQGALLNKLQEENSGF